MLAKGQVIDSATGISLPQANVTIYQQVQCVTTPCPPQMIGGTASDMDGHFEIEVPDGAYIEITYMGFRSQLPLMVHNVHQIIKMEQDSGMLPQAVVTAGRTYWKYALAALVVGIAIFIWRYK